VHNVAVSRHYAIQLGKVSDVFAKRYRKRRVLLQLRRLCHLYLLHSPLLYLIRSRARNVNYGQGHKITMESLVHNVAVSRHYAIQLGKVSDVFAKRYRKRRGTGLPEPTNRLRSTSCTSRLSRELT